MTLFLRDCNFGSDKKCKLCHPSSIWDNVRFLRLKKMFGAELMSKNQWSFALGISHRSLQRWERVYIDSPQELLMFARVYHKSFVLKPSALDGYRRLVLTVIYFLKKGWITGRIETKERVIKWLIENQSNISRRQYEEWVEKE